MNIARTAARGLGRRTRRALLAAAASVALAAAALPPAADAASVTKSSAGTLFYQAQTDEANRVTIAGTGFLGEVSVHDAGAPINGVGGGCDRVSANEVRCSVRRLDVQLGDNADRFTTSTGLPTLVQGGDGPDRYVHTALAGIPTEVTFIGGTGRDTADYSAIAGTVGVNVTKDDLAGDGRRPEFGPNGDRDNIRNDVEVLVGSPFADVLGGSDFALPDEFSGGRGDDVMSGFGGDDVFRMGSSADGADKVDGDAGRDTVDYSLRTRPVNVTLSSGGADDGELLLERDQIDNVEVAFGGRGLDNLVAPPGSTAAFELHGGPGGDNLFGSDGPDSLHGDAGDDFVRAGGGDDLVFAADGEAERKVDCGAGFEKVLIDSQDLGAFRADPTKIVACGNLILQSPVGRSRLSPARLRARAGEPARLELSWTHPRGWRRLDKVELLLEHRGSRIARIVLDQQSGRISGGGRGVELIAGQSAVRPGPARRKRVQIRLALRLGERLAGRTLAVKAAASDDDGTRQPPRLAGRIHVLP
jgi:Ca2+-binding RTX toxin-like protein